MAKKPTIAFGVKVGRLRDIAANEIKKQEVEKMRRAVGLAAYRGAQAMRDKILNSPTNSNWHRIVSEQRGHPGGRYDTGTMYGAVTYNRGRIEFPKDLRRSGKAIAAFGWPSNSSGDIKDAPTAPAGPPGFGSWGEWRQDPRYFVMQEYGFDNEGVDVPGMYSQKAGAIAADAVMDEFFRKNGYK